jgi:hypothetical protein
VTVAGNMTQNAIVEEVRAVRDETAKEYDYDIGAIFAALRKMAATGPGHQVSLAPRNVADPNAAGSSGVPTPPPVHIGTSGSR